MPEWTTDMVRAIAQILDTECFYCLDGADREALPCPECGLESWEIPDD